MFTTIILPGIGGSGEDHWQTYWERSLSGAIRFHPRDWNHPDLIDWIEALDRTVAESQTPPLLVAHSLACLLVAHWAARSTRSIRGALLVAVPDPDIPVFPVEARSFANAPASALPFPALVIASTNDPFASLDYVSKRAKGWGSGLVIAGAIGHINEASGLNDWPQGAALFEAFCAGTNH